MKNLKALFVLLTFTFTSIMPPQGWAQALTTKYNVSSLTALGLMPKPGTAVSLSSGFDLAHFKGMVINPNDPFKFDFIIHQGDENLSYNEKQQEYTKLIKYFLAALAVPDTDQWVNLSPYEKNRIIANDFGKTEMGRDLLAQDYLLKQLSSSLTNPETGLGQKFWNQVYERVYQEFGTREVPLNTFNKVWIVPDKAVIYEEGNMVYVISSHLKVMTEADYLAMKKHQQNQTLGEKGKAMGISNQVMRQVIIPAIEKEVNEGKNFAPLRQVFSGMLLATWYKRALKESILARLYANKGKLKGVDQDPQANVNIYQDYIKAYKKGVYNMIKEETDPVTQEVIPRKYFSGGFMNLSDLAMVTGKKSDAVANEAQQLPELFDAKVTLDRLTAVGKGTNILKKLIPVGLIAHAAAAGTAHAGGAKVSLQWTETDQTVAGFALYSQNGTNVTRIDVGLPPNNIVTLTGLVYGANYTFDVTAYDASGKESSPSSSIVYSTPNLISVNSGTNTFQLTGSIPAGATVTWTTTNPNITNISVNSTTGVLTYTTANTYFIGEIDLNVNGTQQVVVPVKNYPVPAAVLGAATVQTFGQYNFISTTISIPNGAPIDYTGTMQSSPTPDFANPTTLGPITITGGTNVPPTIYDDPQPSASPSLYLRFKWDNNTNNLPPSASNQNPSKSGNLASNAGSSKNYIAGTTNPVETGIVSFKVDFREVPKFKRTLEANRGKTETRDVAMLDKGGIDFAESNLDLQIKHDGKGMPLPISQQNLDNIRIDGLVPVILDIKPVQSTLLFGKNIEGNSLVANS